MYEPKVPLQQHNCKHHHSTLNKINSYTQTHTLKSSHSNII